MMLTLPPDSFIQIKQKRFAFPATMLSNPAPEKHCATIAVPSLPAACLLFPHRRRPLAPAAACLLFPHSFIQIKQKRFAFSATMLSSNDLHASSSRSSTRKTLCNDSCPLPPRRLSSLSTPPPPLAPATACLLFPRRRLHYDAQPMDWLVGMAARDGAALKPVLSGLSMKPVPSGERL
uniref:Uncharacterized protein n=1 Tax=Oryza barthii TaxID=65489 RepID=A0A0D3F5L3_9ORYZ